MGAWGRDQNVSGKVRMMADGAAEYTKKLGLEFDVPNLGVRCRRFSMLVDNGVVKSLNIEEPKQFAVSDADTMLKQLG
jgi:peroxiredoxin